MHHVSSSLQASRYAQMLADETRATYLQHQISRLTAERDEIRDRIWETLQRIVLDNLEALSHSDPELYKILNTPVENL